jgi:hypothetical protein
VLESVRPPAKLIEARANRKDGAWKARWSRAGSAEVAAPPTFDVETAEQPQGDAGDVAVVVDRIGQGAGEDGAEGATAATYAEGSAGGRSPERVSRYRQR